MSHDMEPYSIKFNQKEIVFSGCELVPMFQTLNTKDKVLRLREKLFSVIYYLADNQDKLVSREQLIDECWLGNSYTGSQAVTHSICHIRKILKKNNIDATITTLSKKGYIFSCGKQKIFLDSSANSTTKIFTH